MAWDHAHEDQGAVAGVAVLVLLERLDQDEIACPDRSRGIPFHDDAAALEALRQRIGTMVVARRRGRARIAAAFRVESTIEKTAELYASLLAK